MTQLYNLTCYRADDNETESVTERFNSTVERTIINFNASANVYTCCTSVITQIGGGPVACGKVESLPPGSEAADNSGTKSTTKEPSSAGSES